jgi:hypothetical protein
MHSITVQSHVGTDGVLHLDVPVNLKDTDVEVVIHYHPLSKPASQGWEPGFFEEVRRSHRKLAGRSHSASGSRPV